RGAVRALPDADRRSGLRRAGDHHRRHRALVRRSGLCRALHRTAPRPHSPRVVSRRPRRRLDPARRGRLHPGPEQPDGLERDRGAALDAGRARAGGPAMTALAAVARLDFAAIRRSRWIWFCLATYAALAVVLVMAS